MCIPFSLLIKLSLGKVTGAFQWAVSVCPYPFSLIPLLYPFDLTEFVACPFHTVVWRYSGVFFTYVSSFLNSPFGNISPVWEFFHFLFQRVFWKQKSLLWVKFILLVFHLFCVLQNLFSTQGHKDLLLGFILEILFRSHMNGYNLFWTQC